MAIGIAWVYINSREVIDSNLDEINPAKNHIQSLDGLRGLAIILVLWHHWWVVVRPVLPAYIEYSPVGWIGDNGNQGVSIFFALSGYLITSILLASRDKPNFFKNFFVRRILRICPIYYVALMVNFWILRPLIFALCPLPFASAYLGRPSEYDSWLWLYCGNFAYYAGNSWLFGTMSHFWSLSVEEHYYLIWPFIVYFTRGKPLTIVCVGVCFLSIFARAACLITHHQIAESTLTFCVMDKLALGSLMAVLVSRQTLFGFNHKSLVLLSSGLFALYCVNTLLNPETIGVWCHRIIGIVGPTLWSLLFAIAALITCMKDSMLWRVCSNPVLAAFGRYSYGLYVWHMLFRIPFGIVDPRFKVSEVGGFLLYTAIYFGGSFAAGYLSYHLIEKRFLDLKQYFVNH